MDNRRQFARVDYEILANYAHCEPLEGGDEGMAKTLNLSVSGLLLQLPRNVDVGVRLELALNLDGQIVDVVGKVVRSGAEPDDAEMFEIGVELVSVPDRFVETVESFFSKR